MNTRKSRFLTVRLSADRAEAFREKSAPYGGVSAVLREFVEAWLDRRLVIEADPSKEPLYVNRK